MRKRFGCACRRRPVGSGDAVRTNGPFGVLGRLRCHRQLSRRGGRPSGNDAGRLSLCFCLSAGDQRLRVAAFHRAAQGCRRAEPLDDVPAAESRYAAVEALELLRFLDEGEREVVILCVYTALPYKELAALLGITVPAAQKRYQRAMKKLRAL